MSDHPDIEKLPLEIEGTPVREVVREIFHDPNHGAPYEITPAGCLALARKGAVVWNAWREVFPVTGASVENEIIEMFVNLRMPVNHAQFKGVDFREETISFSDFHFGGYADFQEARWGDRTDFRGARWGNSAKFQRARWGNHVDFQGARWGNHADFQGARWGNSAKFRGAQWGVVANFEGAQWGNWANFEGAQWGVVAKFQEAQWGKHANFERAQWGEHANFEGAQWGEHANFEGAQWGDEANFQEAQWSDRANFQGARWGYNADFQGAQWGNITYFIGAQWGDGADFRGARWKGDVDFSGADWALLKGIYSSVQDSGKGEEFFEERKRWAEERGLDPTRMRSMDFSGVQFGGAVDFQKRIFTSTLKFSRLKGKTTPPRPVIFKFPPRFHGSELYQDTSFEGAEFPPPTGEEEVARAYRTLKLAFSKQQAVREEQRFFRLEMAEEGKGAKWHTRGLYLLYQVLSDYGFSLWRPVISWIFFLFLFAMIYEILDKMPCVDWLYGEVPSYCSADRSTEDSCWVSYQNDCLLYWDMFKISWDMFINWDMLKIKTSLVRSFPLPGLARLQGIEGLSFWEIAATAFHKILSFALFFLAGLAIRNRFKIK